MVIPHETRAPDRQGVDGVEPESPSIRTNNINGHGSGVNGHANPRNGHGQTTNGLTNRVNGHTKGSNGVSGHTNITNGVNFTKANPQAPVAVVGMACRFAGQVTSPADLWELCVQGRDCWSPIPKDRFDVKSLYHPDRERPGRNHAIGGYFMDEDVAAFDAAFFNFPADVASAMDPQIRQLLEIVYEATEDAGIPIEDLAGSNTSVFSGCYGKDYHDLQTRDPEAMPPSFLTGNYTAMMSNRISHFYNLQGASMSIDTGCSAGIACLHQGCLTIRTGESDVSIVGASSTMLNPDLFLAMSTLGMVGTDGRCYAWDERAQGYGRGEGVAALVLKSLDAALRDGDRIHAVIRDTGLNQDGKTQSITSPSIDAQVRLIQDCYQRAGLDLSETGYIEAHMTGTQAGDLAESTALAQTFGASRRAANYGDDPILVGSVKTNIGHTEGVSGLAAIIKAAYAMKHRKVPANLNYAVGNPKIKLRDWHLSVPTALTPWPEDKPLRTSINNFGYGGTNSHVILDGPPSENHSAGNGVGNGNGNGHAFAQHETRQDDDSRVFVISAKDASVARTMAKNLAGFLQRNAERAEALYLDDLAYTLAERRSRLDYVAAIKAKNLNELLKSLESSSLKVSEAARKKPRLGFVFNGQGAQWHAMGRELLTRYPVFASAVEDADQLLRSFGADWSLKEELMRDAASTRVSEIHLSQPITVALQLCLVELLQSWNVKPSAVVSHSSGEIAAAFAVGALSFRQALAVVYHRGELARKYEKLSTTKGGMLAAGIGAEEAKKIIANTAAGGRVVVACVNSPESVTLSGDAEDLDEVLSRLERESLFVRKLKVPLAYHSHHMLPMAPEYTEKLTQLLPAKCSWTEDIVYASPVTGALVSPADGLPPKHWSDNLTSPVLFDGAFEAMSEHVDAIVEIGPHGTLSGPIRHILKGRKKGYVSCLTRGASSIDTMQDLACELIGLGYPVLLKAVNTIPGTQTPKFLPDLPTYAWNHKQRYWVESRVNQDIRQRRFPPHELLGLPVPGGTPMAVEWRNFLRLADIPWLIDHQVDSQIVLPGAAYISMAVEAARLLADESKIPVKGYRVRNAEFLSALTLPESAAVEVCLRLQPADTFSWYDFQVYSLGVTNAWVENCRGQVSVAEDQDTSEPPHIDDFLGPKESVNEVDAVDLLARMRNMGLKYGPSFQNLTHGHAAAKRSVMNLRISEEANAAQVYDIHPTTLDCIIQAAYNALPHETSKDYIVLPRSIHNMFIPSHVHKLAGTELRVFTELQKSQRRGFTSGITVANFVEGGAPSPLRIDQLFCQAIPRGDDSEAKALGSDVLQYQTFWQPDTLHDIPNAIKDSMSITLTDEETTLEKKLSRAAYYLILDAVAQLEKQSQDNWSEHHKITFSWMKAVIEKGKKNELGPGSKMWFRATKGMKQGLYDELTRGDASGQLLVRVGTKLSQILQGELSPSDLMKEGDLLNKYYTELPMLARRSYKHLADIVKLIALKQPGANVLELGGAAGDASLAVLEAFSGPAGNLGSLLGQYTFSDASAGNLEAARQRLAAWEGLIDYQRLDIGNYTVDKSSSVVEGSFDLIVASMSLYTAKDLTQALRNVRRLLKPGGKLLLLEITQVKLDMQLIFSTLPEWWSSDEAGRPLSPYASVGAWGELLRDAEFTGIDFEIGDCTQQQFQSSSVLLSSVAEVPKLTSSLTVVHTTSVPRVWNDELLNAIQEKTRITANVENWSEVLPENKIYLFTGDMSDPFLENMDQTSFEKLQELLGRSRGVLWLSSGGLIKAQSPAHAQTQGFLRTLRQEDTSKRLVHLDFERDDGDIWTVDKIPHIVHVLCHSMDEAKASEDVDWEYAVQESVLHVPRVFPDDGKVVAPEIQSRPFHVSGRSLVWQPSGSIFIDNITDVQVPSDMVEIEIAAFDVKARQIPDSDAEASAFSFAGVITRCGADAEAGGLRARDRVAGVANGPFASTVLIPWAGVVKISAGMSFPEATCIPSAFAAATHALLATARLRQGESILIHPATNSVSLAAIAVGQQTGADVFVTFDDDSKREVLLEKYKVPASRILSVHDSGIAAKLMSQTNGKGIDVILTAPSKFSLESVDDCFARFGRFVQVEDAANLAVNSSHTISRERCSMYAKVDMTEVAQYDSRLFREAMENGLRAWQDWAKGLELVWPIVQYPPSRMKEALQYQRQQQDGSKTVAVVPVAGDVVDAIVSSPTISLDRPDATYLIVGGSGGIGQAVAFWLMDHGAKNLLVVSRNAESRSDAAEFLEKARARGCNLRVQNCDVVSEESVAGLLKGIKDSMPPIRGVVDAAMLLDDTVFERMTYSQWKRAVSPKVVGTVNLAKHLPENLSFFILLSSITGVAGHLSQANYAAGNTFQDAFARHRAATGRPTVSINLAAVIGAGVVADDESARKRVETLGTKSISIQSVLGLIGKAIHQQHRTPDDAQMMVNLAPWNDLTPDAPVRRDLRFGTLRSGIQRTSGASVASEARELTPSELLAQALDSTRGKTTAEETEEGVSRALATRLAAIFNIKAEEIDLGRPLASHGVDSLVAVEFRNWLAAAGSVKVSIFEILQAASIHEIAALVLSRRDAK